MVETAPAFRGRYLSLTTYRRDGTPVATPVWFAEEGGRLVVQTDAGSGKVKRIRANPGVTVALCGGTGRLKGDPVPARAQLLGPAEVAHVEELIRRKYRGDLLLIGPLRWAQKTFHLGKDRGPSAALALSVQGDVGGASAQPAHEGVTAHG